MDLDKKKRRQSLKIILSESIMVIAVIVMVAILALIVSGYWINSDFKVERQGLLQISSIPTGANVEIDGESAWMQRTNTSKVLASGQHSIVLTKEGYDTWSKTVDVQEGLLYRIHYPRLFLKDRTPTKLLDTANATMATISPDHKSLILVNDTTDWKFIDLSADKIEPKKLPVADLFSSVSLAESTDVGLFTGEILSTNWDVDSDHVLFKVKNGEAIEWVLLNAKDYHSSINLSKEFGNSFDRVEILDNSASNLLVMRDGNLQKIDLSSRSISSILIDNVIDFDHYNNELVFSAVDQDQPTQDEPKSYYIGLTKIGDDKITKLKNTDSEPRVLISKFYEDKYITVLENNNVSLYKVANFESVFSGQIGFTPTKIISGHNGEFSIMSSGSQIATLDMEAMKIVEWSTDSEHFGWIDNDMIYSTVDGDLIVYDFDGFNRRKLAKNVSSHFPSMITENKWLYYFSDNNLVREVINN